MSTVLITGGSRGIGEAIARRFHKEGWNVIINYSKNAQRAAALAETLPGSMAICADVADPEAVRQMFSVIKEKFGHIDVLVNNAGIAQDGLFIELTEADWRHIFDVNFFGAVHCIREALPDMLNNHMGKILNISSIWGLKGASCESAYASTKAALIGLTRSLAKEYGLSGVRVNCIAPGVIDTEMNAVYTEETMNALRDEIPLGRIGSAQDVAELAWFLCSPAADYITGQVISSDGGWNIA